MLKVLEQLNSVPRVVLENINDKLIRDGSQCGSNSLANSSTGDAGSGSNMQRYVIKKTSDPGTSASLNLTLVGTGRPAAVKRKASLEQALSDADGAYQRPKKSKKGERTQPSGGQISTKPKTNQPEKVKLDKQKGSDSEAKSSTKGDKSVKRKKRTSRIIDHAESSAVDSDMDSQLVTSIKEKKLPKKRNSISSNPDKDKEGKSQAKSAEQDINQSSQPVEQPKASMTEDLDVTMELPRPDSAMTVALDADGHPVALSDRDDLTEPGGDVANLNDFNVDETPSNDLNSEIPANGEVVPPEAIVPENDPPTPQIVTSFTLANADVVDGDESTIELLVSSQGQLCENEPENVVAVADSSVVEAETVIVAEVSEPTEPVAAEQNPSSSTSEVGETPVAQPSASKDGEQEAIECEETTPPGEVAEPVGIEAIPAVGADVVQETSVEPMETVVEPIDTISNQATEEANHVKDVTTAAPMETAEVQEPAVTTLAPEICEPAPVELPSEAEQSSGIKRKYSIIYHDIQPDSLDAEEKETKAALRTIADVLLDMKRDRRELIKETRQLRAQSRVHEKEMAVQRQSMPALQELVKQLTEQESGHAEERNRRASAAKEAHEKVFQTEIKLRELQLEICKKKLKIVVDMEKNGENPEVQAIRLQEEEAAELTREMDRQNVCQREAESARISAEEQLSRSKEELSTARKQLEEAEKALDAVVKEVEANKEKIEQSVSRLRELDQKWKAKNIESLDLEKALIQINTCRQLLKYESRRMKFSRTSDPECSSDESDDEKKEEKMDTSEVPKHLVSTVKASDEASKAVPGENGSQVGGQLRIHQRATRMSVDGPNTAPSSARPTGSTPSPAHLERSTSVPQKSPSLIDSLAVRSAPPSSNLAPAFFAHSPDDLTQSSISTAIPFYAQLVRGSSPPALKDENTLCREVVIYCAHYARYCRSTQTTPPMDQKAHHQKCAAMMKDFLIPFYHLLVMKNKESSTPMSVKEMLDFVQAKAMESNWYDLQDPRPSSKALEYHLKRAVDYAIKWKDKGFTSSAPSVPINTVTFSPANGSQLATYTIHPAPLPPAPEQFRSPPGVQQPQQVSRTIAESNVTSSSSPMNALNSMITNQPRMHNPGVTGPSNSDEAMMRNRQAAERQAVERQFNTFHAATVAQGNVPSSSAMQVVMHQQRPILQVQPLPTSTSWQMARPPVAFVQQNRFHHMPYPPGAAPSQQPPHGYRVSNFPGVEQQLVMNANDLPGRPSVVRPGMPQQQPQLIRQHSIPPMAGQQPMAHHSGQLPPPPAHHSQLAPVVSTMYLQTTRQHVQPQQKQQPRAIEQVQQPPQQQQPIVVPVYRCLKCNREADQKCSGCQNTYYCSRECQVSHWDEHAKNCASQ